MVAAEAEQEPGQGPRAIRKAGEDAPWLLRRHTSEGSPSIIFDVELRPSPPFSPGAPVVIETLEHFQELLGQSLGRGGIRKAQGSVAQGEGGARAERKAG